MENGVGSEFLENFKELLFFGSNVDFVEIDVFACDFLPPLNPFLNSFDGINTKISVLFINTSSSQIVQNQHLMSFFGESEGQRPSNEPVSSSDDNFHFFSNPTIKYYCQS